MLIQDASNPAGEVALAETANSEAATEEVAEGQEEVTPEDNAVEQSDEGENGEGGEDEDEEIELNFGGDKLRVPKSAIPTEVAEKISEFSKNLEAGVTKKFQEVAETRKSLEARERAVEKLATLNGETLTNFSKGLAIRAELDQLSQIDIQALWQSNPDQARRTSDLISQKNAELQSIVNTVAQKEHELTQAQQVEIARRMDEGKQQIERRIKGFSEKDITDYAIKCGIPKEDAGKWALNPTVTEAFWKAMQYDRMQAAKPKTQVQKQPVPVAPMKTKGSVKAAPDVSRLSPAGMAKYLGLPS